MDNEKMGLFIAGLRKEKGWTQKELAEKVNVSDKAVSKWERGLSCPDIALLSPLAGILGVTTTELLNGARAGAAEVNVEAVVENALEYGEKAGKQRKEINRNIVVAAVSVFFLLGIFVVAVVDVAISGRLTWSLIPIFAMVYAWLVLMPAVKLGVRGIFWSLVALSVLLAPFLYALALAVDRVLGAPGGVFAMGIRIAPVPIAFLWVAYFLCRRFKGGVLLTVAILTLLSSPVSYFINAMVARMSGVAFGGVSMVLNTFIPVVAAAVLFGIEYALRRKRAERA